MSNDRDLPPIASPAPGTPDGVKVGVAEHPTFSQGFMIPPGEPIVGKTYRADGWAYHDMLGRWLFVDDWNAMVMAISEPHVEILAITRRGNAVRGQFIVHPDKHALVAGFLDRSAPSSAAALSRAQQSSSPQDVEVTP